MAEVNAIMNGKGGVGKTATEATLAERQVRNTKWHWLILMDKGILASLWGKEY